MSVYKWILIAFFAFASLSSIGTIGKPRNVMTPGVAVASVCVSAVLCVLVVLA